MERRAVSISADYRATATGTFSFGSGAGLGGRLILNDRRYEIDPGAMITAAYSRRLLDGRGAAPFLLFGLSIGGSAASTHELVLGKAMAPSSVSLFAFDIRLGLTVGKTFWNVLSPYLAARVFGGPVIWNIDGQTRTGTDVRHFQIALGMVSSLPRGFDLFVEAAPGGERTATIGGGVSF